MLVKLISLAAFVPFLLKGCEQFGQCNELMQPANDPRVQAVLKEWVTQNIEGRQLNNANLVSHGGGILPWEITNSGIDWSSIGLPETYGVRLLLDSTAEFVTSDAVESVMFGEGGRSGILVRRPSLNDDSFGLRDDLAAEWLTPVADDVAVLCILD